MKKVISKTQHVFMVLIIMLTFSCSGEDGADGLNGATGQDGTNGEDGNANVTSVLLENISFVPGETTLTVTELNQDILDSGVVIGYLRNSGESTWFALPLSFGGFELFIQSIQLGSITIRANYVGNVTDFRFVLIESTNKSASSSSVYSELKTAGVDINNFNEVMDYYGLDY